MQEMKRQQEQEQENEEDETSVHELMYADPDAVGFERHLFSSLDIFGFCLVRRSRAMGRALDGLGWRAPLDAAEAVMKHGKFVFQRVTYDALGVPSYEYDGGMRRQIVVAEDTVQELPKGAGRILKNLMEAVRAALPPGLGRLGKVSGATVMANNVPEGAVGLPQDLHIDQALVPSRCAARQPPPPQVIVAVERCTLLVVPFSHHMVEGLGWMTAKAGEAAAEAADETLAPLLPPSMKPTRIHLDPGQLVVMHGYLVHAGDAGEPGEAALRVHFYTETPAGLAPHPTTEDATYVLDNMGDGVVSTLFSSTMLPKLDQSAQPPPVVTTGLCVCEPT